MHNLFHVFQGNRSPDAGGWVRSRALPVRDRRGVLARAAMSFALGPDKRGELIGEGTVQPEHAVSEEAHHGGRRERLRAGSERKNGIRPQRWCWVSMPKHAKGFVHHDHATPGHQHCYARSVTLRDPAADEFAQSPYPDGIHPDVLRCPWSQLSAFHFRTLLTRAGRRRSAVT